MDLVTDLPLCNRSFPKEIEAQQSVSPCSVIHLGYMAFNGVASCLEALFCEALFKHVGGFVTIRQSSVTNLKYVMIEHIIHQGYITVLFGFLLVF